MDVFPHLYGQEAVKKELLHLYKENRVPHTLLFYGDEGLGKTTAAFDFAGALTGKGEKLFSDLSLVTEEEKKKALVLTFADEQVWYLHPVGRELKIEQFRIFLSAMASFDEKVHVCIIDEAQTMMAPVANSLLKTLEEPEGNVHFILITHDLDALLPTIISRGERFGFAPLSREAFLSFMEGKKNQLSFPPGMDESILFQLSEGNPGITVEVCDEKGRKQPGSAMEVWEMLSQGRAPFARLSGLEFKEREDLRKMIRWMILVGRDMMVLAETGNLSMVRCVSIAQREMSVSRSWPGERWEDALRVLKTAETAVSRYINVKNIWDMILIELEHIQKGEKKWNR